MLMMQKGLIKISICLRIQQPIIFLFNHNFGNIFHQGKIVKAGKFAVGIILPPAKRSTDCLECGMLFTFPVSLDFFLNFVKVPTKAFNAFIFVGQKHPYFPMP